MPIGDPRVLAVVYGVNVVLGAVLYLDVVRTRRSGWWLIAFWLLTYPALLAYLITKWQQAHDAGPMRARR